MKKRDWKKVKLGEVLKYEQPKNYIVSSADYKDSFSTPVLTPGKSFILGYTDDIEGIYTKLPVILFDDFTTAFRFIDFPFKVKSSAVKFLTAASDDVDIKYLFYQLKMIRVNSIEHRRYWISKFSNLQIPLPPIPEQKAIAAQLDRADKLRQDLAQSLKDYDRLLAASFLDMFGDPVLNPKGWEVRELDTLGTLNRGKSKHRPRNAPELLGGKYPLIQTGDVANSNFLISEYHQTYSELGFRQSKIWPKGTLCITIAANIAKAGILNFDACFPDSIVGFIPGKDTNTSYIYYWLSFWQKILEENAPESAQKNINLKILRGLKVCLPPLALQQQFAQLVERIERQKALIQSAQQSAEDLFGALLQAYFYEGK